MTLNCLRYLTAAMRHLASRSLLGGVSRASPLAACQPSPGTSTVTAAGRAGFVTQLQQIDPMSVCLDAPLRRLGSRGQLRRISSNRSIAGLPASACASLGSRALHTTPAVIPSDSNALPVQVTSRRGHATLSPSALSIGHGANAFHSSRQTPLHRRGFTSVGTDGQSSSSSGGRGMTDPSHLYSHPTLTKNVKICGTCSASATESEHEHGPTQVGTTGASTCDHYQQERAYAPLELAALHEGKVCRGGAQGVSSTLHLPPDWHMTRGPNKHHSMPRAGKRILVGLCIHLLFLHRALISLAHVVMGTG